MKKRLFFIIAVTAALLLFSGLYSCDGKQIEPEPEESETEQESEDLKGTVWKLAGVVNAETGEVRVLRPKDCADCFTLTFYSAYEAWAYSVTMNVKFDLLDLDPERLMHDLYIEEGGYPDGQDFRDAVLITGSVTVAPDELKLFYNNKTEYLLFKPCRPRTEPLLHRKIW